MKAEFGLTSGMRLREYLAYLFDFNDRATVKLSDVEIGYRLVAEFPNSQVAVKYSEPKRIWSFRLEYNRGVIARTVEAPLRPSFRYEDGVMVSRIGKPLNKNAIVKAFQRQHQRWEIQQRERTKEEVKPHPIRKYKKLGAPRKRKKKKKYKKVHKATWHKNIRLGKIKEWQRRKARWLQRQMEALQTLPASQDSR